MTATASTDAPHSTSTPAAGPASIRAEARTLIDRWDAQQTGYIRHRADRFATIARVTARLIAGQPRPRVLDLAGGPGSLGLAVLADLPEAQLVVADKDPALLALAADATADDPRVTLARVDLADRTWTGHPAIAAAPFDAVVSSTALHWLAPDVLVQVYFALAEIVRPGGIVLNGDHLAYDETAEPTLRAIAADDDEAVQRDAAAAGIDTWEQWWDAVAAHPRYAAAMTERARVWGPELHQAPPKVTAGFHRETLRSAGFAEAGTVWQYLDDLVVYAIR